MHIVDLAVVTVAAVVVLALVLILARQRFMLRAPGTIPVAVRPENAVRWQYGVARYSGEELQWFRSLGLGTRPSRTLMRSDIQVLSRRGRADSERQYIPESSVVVECRDRGQAVLLAFGDNAYTGFVSWLESSAPA